MPKPLQKHTLLLFQGDFEALRALHPEVPPSEIIRTLVQNHIARVQKEAPTPQLSLTD